MTHLAVLAFLLSAAALTSSQRISTIQLDNTQYFISQLNPYAPQLNFFVAYQYCRSLGLQLTSFETKEKADTLSQYLKNAGYNKVDYWTSGNKLGTEMLLWMSTGLPFNATFNYMSNAEKDVSAEDPSLNAARQLDVSHLGKSCVALTGQELSWELHDCGLVKDFICEQTRCYYYNYGSIPVSAAQGGSKPTSEPSTAATSDTNAPSASYTQEVPLPTTPYPGMFDNSVSPQNDDENVEEHVEEHVHDEVEEVGRSAESEDPLMGKPDPNMTEGDEDGSEGVAMTTTSEVTGNEEGAESSETMMDMYYSGAATMPMAGGGNEEPIMSVTTSPHQPKRLEELFPMERTRPIVWPRN